MLADRNDVQDSEAFNAAGAGCLMHADQADDLLSPVDKLL